LTAHRRAGRLIGESGSDGRGIAYENAWQYDAAGNRVGETYRRATAAAPGTLTSTTTISAQFNANDWLLSQSNSTTNVGGATSTYGTTWGYDDNGSQTGQSSNGGAAQLNAWDFQGQLASVGTQGTSAPHTRYATDAGGNRLSVTTGLGSASPKTSSFLTDPNTSYAQVLAQHDSDGEDARWVWEESLAPLTMTRGGRTFFYLADGQDSVRQLTDEAGRVTDSYFYDAWGNQLAGGSGTTKNPFRYTGQQQDQDGKYFLRARYYNSGIGRFLSQDTVMGNSDDPVTLHRYLYAGDDSVNHIDPSGEEFSLSGMMSAIGSSIVRAGPSINAAFVAYSRISTIASGIELLNEYRNTGHVDPMTFAFFVIGVFTFNGGGPASAAKEAVEAAGERVVISGMANFLFKWKQYSGIAADVREGLMHEIKVAKYLRALGRNVHFAANDSGMGDIIIDGAKLTGVGGKAAEIYSPLGTSLKNILDKVPGKFKQSGNKYVVLNLSRSGVTDSLEVVEAAVKARLGARAERVIIITTEMFESVSG